MEDHGFDTTLTPAGRVTGLLRTQVCLNTRLRKVLSAVFIVACPVRASSKPSKVSRGHPCWKSVQTSIQYLKRTSEGSRSSYIVRVKLRLPPFSLNEPEIGPSASPSCAFCC